MAVTTLNSLTNPTAITGNAPVVLAVRFGLGLAAMQRPVGFKSRGHLPMPRLPEQDQERGSRPDAAYRHVRSAVSAEAPVGPTGSIPGATACRSALLARATTTTGTTAADLKSVRNPHRTGSDYQSPPVRSDARPDRTTGKRWRQVEVSPKTAAK